MRRVAAAAIIAVVLFASCAGSSEVSGDRRTVGNVAMTFTVRPAHVEVGKSVRFTMRLTNISGQPTILTFPTSQQYDFWVTRGTREVWRWSSGRFFTQSIEHRTIDPQATISLVEPWVPRTAGTYAVHGEVQADNFRDALSGVLTVGD